jgi:hypothetical protein
MSGPYKIFIHANERQMIGALVGAYSMATRSSWHPDRFDVSIVRLEDYPHLLSREGQLYLRKGKMAVWRNADLQSFSPLRRMIPQLMNYSGRALVTDPDVFAAGDVYELLSRDMQGKSILCRYLGDGYKSNGNAFYASSVMLLDCEKLRHWNWEASIDQMFAGELDYGPWIGLMTEDGDTIGPLEEEWNSMDILTDRTKLLHNTERSTQPWNTGLPVDFDLTAKGRNKPARRSGLFDRIFGKSAVETYLPHPDPRQEEFFFTLLRDALNNKYIPVETLMAHIDKGHVRPDAPSKLRQLGWNP